MAKKKGLCVGLKTVECSRQTGRAPEGQTDEPGYVSPEAILAMQQRPPALLRPGRVLLPFGRPTILMIHVIGLSWATFPGLICRRG
jgi:hypothetical protein